jgi:pimeloyl-ACP methyl ester carboxylesterase
MLKREDLRHVVVVGSSIGGWIAAELALRDTAGRVDGLVLINSGGIRVEGEPITDVSRMSPGELAEVSFHEASAFPPRPAPTPEGLEVLAGNAAALEAYAGTPYMHDPSLLDRLPGVTVPTLVVWGESDGVFSLGYGRAFAAAIPGARFESVPRAGHLPWIEQPAPVFATIDSFTKSL